MHAHRIPIDPSEPSQITCLACGEVRAACTTGVDTTGECPRCGYLGWTYNDDLDATTRRMIMDGTLAKGEQKRRSTRSFAAIPSHP